MQISPEILAVLRDLHRKGFEEGVRATGNGLCKECAEWNAESQECAQVWGMGADDTCPSWHEEG